MKQYETSSLTVDNLLQDANRHLQQLNYIMKECERRGCADSVVGIASSCEPLYSVLVRPQLAQVEQERDDLSTEIETCHALLDQFYSEDPAMTSGDTLEQRLKLHLDELHPVITDSDVSGDD